MRWLGLFGIPLSLVACDDDPLGSIDAGQADASAFDSGLLDATLPDASASDAGTRDGGVASCSPLTPGGPTEFAHVEGQLSVLEFYTWADDQQETFHWRQWSVGAFSAALEPSAADPTLFVGIAPDSCITVEVPAATRMLSPFRNLGTSLVWSAASGDSVTWTRSTDEFGTLYHLPSGPLGLKFSDPAQTPFDQVWTWHTDGDPAAFIGPATAEIAPVEDFQVDPPITTSNAPLDLTRADFQLRWTAPARTPGIMSIVLSRATSKAGDGRAVICRPVDDGSFTLTTAVVDSLGATPGVAFGFDVHRSQVTPFCNLGIRNGVAMHTIAHLGRAVVP